MSTSNPHLALSLAPTLNFTQNLRTLLDTLTPASIPSTLAQLHALAHSRIDSPPWDIRVLYGLRRGRAEALARVGLAALKASVLEGGLRGGWKGGGVSAVGIASRLGIGRFFLGELNRNRPE